ncbi:HEPN domain-containing protein [Acidithiobacillus sulfurivorans]|uniref:HEPN domain-containing protein n=1 Tax=Acidithiobacillus sulfurivorans TaxID=1958756 RepID=A0ABS6A2F5_9PROT|nr:HEPN domain-containing protein [Acidithiobacillus sulfurivorans]MBU2761684.1 HEPN domain-containing protein [Acidithiobacillus sulfurivorans]
MSDQERIQRSIQWFELAHDDLEAARAVFDKGIYNIACFHSQQAVEKACKGLITVSQGDYDRVHTIGAMLSKMPQNKQIEELDPERLDKFYIATRYPESHAPETRIAKAYGKRDARDAIDTAEGMLSLTLEWAKACGVTLQHAPEPSAVEIQRPYLEADLKADNEEKWYSLKIYADKGNALLASLQITENKKLVSIQANLKVKDEKDGGLLVCGDGFDAKIDQKGKVHFFEGKEQVRGPFHPSLKAPKGTDVNDSSIKDLRKILDDRIHRGKGPYID